MGTAHPFLHVLVGRPPQFVVGISASHGRASAAIYSNRAAAFPTGSFANPTLMAIALALRLADKLLDEGLL